MKTWSLKEKKRLAAALRAGRWTHSEMARFMGSRDAKQCKSHLQKVVNFFIAVEKKLKNVGKDQTVYNSYLLYLAQTQVAPSPGETLLAVKPRPPIHLDEDSRTEHVESDPDFLPLGDLWTTI